MNLRIAYDGEEIIQMSNIRANSPIVMSIISVYVIMEIFACH